MSAVRILTVDAVALIIAGALSRSSDGTAASLALALFVLPVIALLKWQVEHQALCLFLR